MEIHRRKRLLRTGWKMLLPTFCKEVQTSIVSNQPKSKILITILLFLFLSNCTKDVSNVNYTSLPVLSSLFNNRMLLILKGTYASDNPFEYFEINNNTLFTDKDDTSLDVSSLPLLSSLPIYIDFGELRIASKYEPRGLEALQSVRDSKNFWDFIAPQRQVYCSQPYTLFSNTCDTDQGLVRYSELMSGFGAKYPSNDPTADSRGFDGTQYYHAGVYIRTFVTGYAIENGIPKTNTRFDNRDVIGSNIVQRNSYKPGASDIDKQTLTPLMYPIFYTAGEGHKDMTILPGFDSYIIEMRINMKENLMVHSWTNFTGNIQTIVGFSDWRNNHAGEIDMGGNILLRSRVIYPETASTLNITGGTRSLNSYYALYRAEETDFTNQLPLAATPVKGSTANIKYIHGGNYRLKCIQDVNPVDGYPETSIRETTFTVTDTFRQVINVDLTCP